ncbi:MAG: hypothetical protein QM759_05065 [Terricaulis sp.]
MYAFNALFVGFCHCLAVSLNGAIEQLVHLTISVANDLSKSFEAGIIGLDAGAPSCFQHLTCGVEHALRRTDSSQKCIELAFQSVALDRLAVGFAGAVVAEVIGVVLVASLAPPCR